MLRLSGRHAAPRHRAPRRPVRAVERLSGARPLSKPAAVAVLGAAGAVAIVGVVTVVGDASTGDAGAAAGTTLTASAPRGALAGASAAETDNASTDRAVVAALARRAQAARRDGDPTVSRGATRPALPSVQRATKLGAMPVAKQAVSGAVTEEVAPADPRDIARSMLADYGWSSDQFSCLDELYAHESGWNPSAQNPSSGAYGIPQALPGDKMAAYGADWQTSAATQLAWGLAYIRDSYGSPCGAWGFWQSNSWY